jgi:hypothetical protein
MKNSGKSYYEPLTMLDRLFDRLDKRSFLHFHIWEFAYRSFFKEYALLFFLKAMLKHPGKTASGLKAYQRFIKSKENLFPQYQKSLGIPDEEIFRDKIAQQKTGPLLGLGFCLKPHNQKDSARSCPSGHANHECVYLEKGETKNICLGCAVYRIAKKGVDFGCSVYIMTSAKDIAVDFLLPQINKGLFPAAILLLCPYSVQAILPSLFICGIDAYLLAYDSGYCKDYREWRLADLGIKQDRTTMSKESSEKLFGLISQTDSPEIPPQSFRREGNIFYPG